MTDAESVSDSHRRNRGSSIIEFALLMPWYVFLFVGAYDYGFYAYSYIAVENAARIGAMYCANSDSIAGNCSPTVCTYALAQLRNLPNVGSSMSSCTSPVTVSTSLLTGSGSPDSADAASVTVTYTTPSLIPIPNLLPGTITFSRTVTMRILH